MLYFANRSADTSDAYLAEGLTEDIITRLGKVDRLAVQSSNSVRRFRASEEDEAQVGRKLGVANLVTGSVRRFRSTLHVNVELVRVADGLHRWGDAFDRPDSDLLAIEQDIASAVATAIAGQLLPGERTALAAGPTARADAQDHLLRGNHFFAQRTAAALIKAVDEYETAARLDPGSAQALAHVAEAYGMFFEWGWTRPGVSPESLLARGVAAAERALQLGPNSSDAWVAQGYISSFSHPLDYAITLRALEHATALDPRNAEAHHMYGARLEEVGRDSESVLAFQHALEIDPLRPITLTLLGRIDMLARRYTAAQHWVDSALVADPGFGVGYAFRARLHLLQGDTASARHDAETADRLSASDPLQGATVMAMVQAREGDTLTARGRLTRLPQARDAAAPLLARDGTWLAVAFVSVGDSLQALAVLDRMKPSLRVWNLLHWPELDPIRANPRFQRLVRESQP